MRTPDDLINDMMTRLEKTWPDEDPGDLTIVVQDDMPLVTASFDGREETLTVNGSSIQDALTRLWTKVHVATREA